MPRPSHITQPGPAIAPRVEAVEGRGRAFEMVLEPGRLLLETVQEGFAREGFSSGVVMLDNLVLGPFAYVMPALAKDDRNAAYYSETFRPAGLVHLEHGALTFGTRDGAPFFHCHALWREAEGKRSGGHILPEETRVAQVARVRAFGIDGAAFVASPDAEINFKVFGPQPAAKRGTRCDKRAFAVRVHPNICLHSALEQLVQRHGLARATLLGGVGSIIGAAFEDGHEVEPFATEVYIAQGEIAPDAAGLPRARIEAGLVDYTGGMAQGLLARGTNPVLMTFELIVSEP